MFLEIIVFLIKYFAFFFSIFYAFNKISAVKINAYVLLDIAVALILSGALYFITLYVKIIMQLCILLLSTVYLIIRHRNSLYKNIAGSIVACGISSFIFILSTLISVPVNYLCFALINNNLVRNLSTQILYSLLHIGGVVLLFRIKRFKSGVNPDKSDGNFEMLLLCSGACQILMTVFYGQSMKSVVPLIAIIGIIIFGLIFIVRWRTHIKSTYQKQILRRNSELLEQRITSYEAETVELKRQNEELAKIIHRDNKLIPAMAVAVQKIASKYGRNEELDGLLEQLKNLSDERKSLIEKYQSENEQLPKSGVLSLDAVHYFIWSKAEKVGVECAFGVDAATVKSISEKVVNQVNLNTLLCDLGENAVLAAKSQAYGSGGKINITYETDADGIPSISVYDSGAQFTENIIAVIGRKKATTRAENGGNGIGLTTVFETLRKYDASFTLNETPDKDGFTKQIKISFDGASKLEIISERDGAKKAFKKRTDMV